MCAIHLRIVSLLCWIFKSFSTMGVHYFVHYFVQVYTLASITTEYCGQWHISISTHKGKIIKDWIISCLITIPSRRRWIPIFFYSNSVRHAWKLNYASVMSLSNCETRCSGPAGCRWHTSIVRKHLSMCFKWLTVWKLSWMLVTTLEADTVFKFGGQQFAYAAGC